MPATPSLRTHLRLPAVRVAGGTVPGMLFTTHLATGAVLGRWVGHPAPAAAVGLLSHFALDAIPHWGGTDHRAYMRVAAADGLAGLALAAVLARRAWRTRSRSDIAALTGAMAAGLPDLGKPILEATGRDLWPDWVNAIHRGVQRESAAALPREAAVCATAVALCLVAARPAVRSRLSGSRRGPGFPGTSSSP